jgi:hypothetical protein
MSLVLGSFDRGQQMLLLPSGCGAGIHPLSRHLCRLIAAPAMALLVDGYQRRTVAEPRRA